MECRTSIQLGDEVVPGHRQGFAGIWKHVAAGARLNPFTTGTPTNPSNDLTPRVFYHLTDNWLELTVRFIVREHGIRNIKDAIARAVLQRFEEASLEVASATYEIVGLPPVRLQQVSH